MRWNKPESQDELSLREIFCKNKPTDPVKAERWTYWRAVIYSTACIPFFLYLAIRGLGGVPGIRDAPPGGISEMGCALFCDKFTYKRIRRGNGNVHCGNGSCALPP